MPFYPLDYSGTEQGWKVLDPHVPPIVGLDFLPKIRNNRNVNLEQGVDIQRYFEVTTPNT